MKKFLAVTIALIMLLAFSLPAFAEESSIDGSNEDFIIYDEEIEHADIQIQSDGVITLTTVENTPLPQVMAEGGVQLKAADITTTALLINDPNKTSEILNELLSVPHEASSYRTNSDIGSGLRIHSTVYYTVQTESGSDWYRLVRVSGGNSKTNASNVIGSGFIISSQNVSYGVWGRNLEGLPPTSNTWSSHEVLSNSASSFDFNVSSLYPSWPTVSETQSLLGATYTVVVHSTRDGSNRTLEVMNNVLSDVDIPSP